MEPRDLDPVVPTALLRHLHDTAARDTVSLPHP
jgi:hypothetical protein